MCEDQTHIAVSYAGQIGRRRHDGSRAVAIPGVS
jgi:hypothetical protein